MSYFDDASLVMIPSGYKTSKVYSVKPTDGTGDLAFTRSNDTATRVASNGLIERVRTNLLTYSQLFSNAAWVKSGLTLTGSQTDPNGGTTAFLATATVTSSSYFYQTNTTAGCVSIYAKAGTRSKFSIINGLFAQGAEFNLTTQTTIVSGAGSLAKIESVGGGWFRCSVFLSSITEAIIALDEVYGGGVTIGQTMSFAFAQHETGDIATPYIATTTAAVSVGPVANVPRLDYLNSSCPRLLLEPQRTNLALNSESFDNATWTKSNATITANTTVSPDGTQSADTAVITAGGYVYAEFISYAAVTGQSATLSVFAKNATSTLLAFGGATTAGTDVYKIENYGNGWYRHSVVRTFTATATTTLQFIINLVGTSIIWGAQVEGSNSAYVTSYIPTLGASVTRGADACSKTGISSLIGQTEGTLFADFTLPTMANTGANLVSMSLFNAGLTVITSFDIYDVGVLFASHTNVTTQANIQKTGFTAGRHKLAFSYKANDFVLYVDGALVGTDTSGTVGAQDSFGLQYGTSQFIGQQYVSQALLFKTRLTNAQLAELTTI